MNSPDQPLSSLQNDRIKQLIKIHQRARSRKQTGLFCIEGVREIERALAGGYRVEQYFRSSDSVDLGIENLQLKADLEEKTYWVAPKIMEQISYRESSNIIALAEQKSHNLELFKDLSSGLFLVVESIEKPGNLGALLRTAGGIGLDGVCIVNRQTDIYHPNCIRNSMGAVFQIPVGIGSLEEFLSFGKSIDLQLIGAALSPKAVHLNQVKFNRPAAIVVGNEAQGLSPELLAQCHQVAQIPMFNHIDSLNVSVAAGMFMYQALQDSSH